jgi:hypothetical protein
MDNVKLQSSNRTVSPGGPMAQEDIFDDLFDVGERAFFSVICA